MLQKFISHHLARSTLLFCAILFVIAFLAYLLAPLLIPIIISFALYALLEPLTSMIERQGVSRTTSSLTVLLLLVEFEHSQACYFALGARGKPAERVADEAVDGLAKFLNSRGAVDAWLADQLLLPMAMASTSSVLSTCEVTQHLLTNAEVIRHFLPAEISVDAPLGQAGLIRINP